MFLSLSPKRQHSPNVLCFFTKWDKMLLQSETAFLLQSRTEVVTKWDGSCYKVGQVLQSETDVVTKWDRCYKVGRLLQLL